MATKTSNYEFAKPEQNDFYDVDIQNGNWDKVDKELSEFDDSGATEDIKSFPDFLTKFVTGNKVAITLRNLKAGLQFVLHAGQIVNNCVTDNAGLPLSAAQGKVLKDLYTQLYSDMRQKFEVGVITSLDQITKTGWYSCGAIAELSPYMSGGWNIINATVQTDGAARISVLNKYGANIEVYKDADGTYKFFPLVIKSDLETSGICLGGIHIHTTGTGSTDEIKKFTAVAGAHMSGLLLVDQNNTTDVYSIGKQSGVQALLKNSGVSIPTISSNVLSVPVAAWGTVMLISFDEFTLS